MHETYCEDCRVTLKRGLPYDYIITSPPDYDEVGMKPGSPEWVDLLTEIFSLFDPKNNVVTLIMSDRKADSQIYTKHSTITKIMADLGWHLYRQQIWVKSLKRNMFRLTYTFLLTFKRGKTVMGSKAFKMPDVLIVDTPSGPCGRNAFPVDLIVDFIDSYCPKKGRVFDPFMGRGSAGFACDSVYRDFLGSELVPEIYATYLASLDGQNIPNIREMIEGSP